MLHGHRSLIALFTFCLLITGTARAIEGSHTGTWYWQPNSGHGFNVEDLEDGTLLVFWYMYRPDGSSSFLIGVATQQGDGSYLATLQITEGMVFGEFDTNDLVKENWGTLRLTFSDCDSGTAQWTPTYPGYASGSTPIQRLTNVAHTNCTESPFAGNYQVELFDNNDQVGIGRALLLPNGAFVYATLFGNDFEVGRGTWQPTNGTQGSFDATGYGQGAGASPFSGNLNAEEDGISGSTNDGTGFTAVPLPSFQNDLSMAAMAGAWNVSDGLSETALGQVSITAQGMLTGSISTCTLNGQVTVPDANLNQFEISANYSGCGSGTLAGAGAMNNGALSAFVVDAGQQTGQLLILERN